MMFEGINSNNPLNSTDLNPAPMTGNPWLINGNSWGFVVKDARGTVAWEREQVASH